MAQKQTLDRLKKNREERIIEAACKVIKRSGFAQARIADIAAEADISYGLVYHYFRSKEELFDAILDLWWGGLYEALDDARKQELPIREKLSSVITYFLDQYRERPDLVHIFVSEISRSTPNLTPERLGSFKKLMAYTESIIADAQKNGQLRGDIKARYLNYYFLSGIEGFVSTMVVESQALKNRSQQERITESLLELFLNGARPDQ